MVREDVQTDVGLQDFANAILVGAGVRGDVRRSSMREVETLFRFVQFNPQTNHGVIFRRDPTGGTESIQDARETLRRGYGDCDDFAVLLATLLGLVGYVSRFVVIKVNPETSGFDHVYVEVFMPTSTQPDRWIALDPTDEKAMPGYEESRTLERRSFKIFSEHPEGDDLEGFKSFFKKVGKVALKVAPMALSVVPGVGTAAGAAISAGVDAAQGAVDAKAAKKAAAQQAVIGSRPDPRFLMDVNTRAVYRASDGHHYETGDEAWAEGVARDFSNVTLVDGPPTAALRSSVAQAVEKATSGTSSSDGAAKQQTRGGIDQKVLLAGGAALFGSLVLFSRR